MDYYKMEKYIFDCREKLYDSPKFLKRNQNISIDSSKNEEFESDQCPYLKNKIFLTFDYSYYQIIPKTASMHVSNRTNNLNALITHHIDTIDEFRQPVHSFAMNDSKWKKQKENIQANTNLQMKSNSIHKRFRKKLKLPINCMPGVGDYHFQPKNIQKRIVYDVKIRGKPYESLKLSQNQFETNKKQDINKEKQQQIKNPKKDYKFTRLTKTADKKYGSLSKINIAKDRRAKAKHRQNEQEYLKFINPIDATHVWNKLMEKYRLKGTKFDIYGFNQ